MPSIIPSFISWSNISWMFRGVDVIHMLVREMVILVKTDVPDECSVSRRLFEISQELPFFLVCLVFVF